MVHHNSQRGSCRSSVAGRYAAALLELTEEANVTGQVVKEFAHFQTLLEKSPDLQLLVRCPTFSAKQQVEAIVSILKNAHIEGLAAQFIGFVAQNHRLRSLPAMLNSFEYLAVLSKGSIFADVVFAQSPSEKTIKDVTSVLKNVTQKNVSLNISTDPNLIGGLIVTLGSKMVDGSIRSKLNSIRQAMKEIH